jgi:hypothetical protein
LPTDIFDNFGWAGEQYAKFLIKNSDKLGEIIIKMQERYRLELHAQGRERFWINALTVLVAGATFAKRLGLVDFDLQALEEYLKQCLSHLRLLHARATDEISAVPVLAQYLSETFSERLVTDVMAGKGNPAGGGPRVTYLPQRNKPEWQMAKDSKQLLVACARYRDWLRDKGFSLQVASDLDALPFVTKGDYTIGGRTTMAIPRCKAWMIDATGDLLLETLFDY